MNNSVHPHVVYIITKLELGGAQKVCLSLFSNLRKKLFNGCSLISGSGGVLVDSVKGIDSVYLLDSMEREVGFCIKKIFQECKTFFSIISILREIKKKHKNVIVHTHSTKAGIIGRWAAFFAGVKIRMHTVHGYGFHNYQSRLIWLFIYVLEFFTSLITTSFICVSKHDQETGERFFPYFSKKSTIIRAAVEDEKFYPANLFIEGKSSIDDIIIGSISCFKPQKNLIDLLKAFNEAKSIVPKEISKRLRLQIIGDGVLRSNLESWIIQHNLATHVDLLGWQGDVAFWMQSWSIFALSSLWEGLPCATIEARLCKIPVVAYDVGGIKEVIHCGKNGFLVPPGDWMFLAKKIAEIVTCQESLHTMKNHSDELEEFKNMAMANEHLKLYTIGLKKKVSIL